MRSEMHGQMGFYVEQVLPQPDDPTPTNLKNTLVLECYLEKARYPTLVLLAPNEGHGRGVKQKGKTMPTNYDQKISVIPYVHSLSHRLETVPAKYGTSVAWSARNKVAGVVCLAVNAKFDD